MITKILIIVLISLLSVHSTGPEQETEPQDNLPEPVVEDITSPGGDDTQSEDVPFSGMDVGGELQIELGSDESFEID